MNVGNRLSFKSVGWLTIINILVSIVGVAQTILIAIIFGLLLQRSREWPLLLLAILSLTLWNTMLGYVLAYCSSSGMISRRPTHG